MQTGDTVIFIEDETPAQRSQRLGTKRRRKQDQRTRSKVGHLDSVEAVAGKKAKFKKDREADFDTDNGNELPDSRIKRQQRGEPTRKAYLCPTDAFPLPRGMQATIESIELDDATVDAIKRYDSEVRKSRGE